MNLCLSKFIPVWRKQANLWFGKDAAAACLFLLPSGAGFALFYLIPFAMGAAYSVTVHTAGGTSIGLEHYQELLASSSFRKAASNTLLFSILSVPLNLFISLTLAVMLNRNLYLRNWIRAAYVLPLAVPVASIILVWQLLFDWNGSVNAWLVHLGFARRDWMKSEAARYLVILVYLWKNTGYNVILFLAGLQQIPKDYYETAYLEGAGKGRQFFSITLVYLTSTLFFVVIMSIMNSFKVFRETYLMAGDYPQDSIYMLQHYMNNMFLSANIEKLAAAANLLVGGIILIVLGMFAIERRYRRFME